MEITNDEVLSIDRIVLENNLIRADLAINPGSSIFNGHFPGKPVVPGACMLQIVKEVLEIALESSIQFKKAASLKFIAMIDPSKTAAVQLEMSYQINEKEISVKGQLNDGDTVYFKFSATADLINEGPKVVT